MADSYVVYTALGGEDTYAVTFPFLKRSHVGVTKNGVAVTDYSWLSDSQIQFDADVPASVVIKFQRTTPSTPQFNSSDGTVLTNTQLSILSRQSIYLVQETNDHALETISVANSVLDGVEDIADDVAAAEASAVAAAASAAAAATFNPSNYYTTGQIDTALGTRDTAISGAVSDAAAALAAAVAAGPITGDVQITLRPTARSGWLVFNDGTIGDASSSATYANSAAQALFTFMYDTYNDTLFPVSGGRGANASADWAAHKRGTLSKVLGRAIVIAGTPSSGGATARAAGESFGNETQAVPLKNHVHGPGAMAVSVPAAVSLDGSGTQKAGYSTTSDTALSVSVSGNTASAGDGAAPTLAVSQPSVVMYAHVKL